MLCQFTLVIHGRVAFPDDLTLFFAHRDQPCAVRTRRIDGAKGYSYVGASFDWITSRTNVEVYRAAALNRDKSSEEDHQIVVVPHGQQHPAGVLEPDIYCLLEIMFEVPGADELEKRFDDFKSFADEIVVGFCGTYRWVANDLSVPPARLRDSALVAVAVATDYEFSIRKIRAEFKPFKRILHWTDPNIRSRHKPLLPGPEIDQIWSRLKLDTSIQLHESLLLDSKEQGHVLGQYHVSVVLAETAFEAFLQRRLIDTCEARRILALPARKAGASPIPYRRAIQRADLRRDLVRYAEQLAGTSIAGTTAYNRWYRDAYLLRNRVVHSGERAVSEEQAGAAFTAVVAIIDFVKGVLPLQRH